ncbi:MAG: hypothetical protein GY801_23245 [bacterium]|nr:hypothetical protein [bacterium]
MFTMPTVIRIQFEARLPQDSIMLNMTRKLVGMFSICFFVWAAVGFAGELEGLTDEIAPQVAELRGLPFVREVEKYFQSPEELKQVLLVEIERAYPGDSLQNIAKRLLKFGFVARPVDLKQTFMRLLSQQIAGYYDPIEKKMVLIKGSGSMGSAGSPLMTQIISNLVVQQWGLSLDKILLAHELTHVVQDQHFDLMSLPIEDLQQEDRGIAARALIEGDATLLMMDYMLNARYPGADATMAPDIADNMRFWTTSPLIRSFSMFRQVPRYLMDNLLFSYIGGFEFALRLKERGGWEAVNQAYKDPPASSEQILHPEKYFEERDDPLPVELPDLSEYLSDWVLLEENTLGEFNIRLLLDSYLPVEDARRGAAGWGGDRFRLYEHSDTGSLALIWQSAWDREEDSREFFHKYAVLLEKRYGQADEAALELLAEKMAAGVKRLKWEPESGRVSLEMYDNKVLMLDGFAEEVRVNRNKRALLRSRESADAPRKFIAPGTGVQSSLCFVAEQRH